MFFAWFATFFIFFICIATTFIIIEGVKVAEHNELAILKSKYKNISIPETGMNRKIA